MSKFKLHEHIKVDSNLSKFIIEEVYLIIMFF